MTVLTVLLEAIARLAALGLGGWLAYTEASGTYEFYLEQAGGVVTFLVRATVGITLATVILPYFMSRAVRQRRYLRAFNILAAFLLCVSVILTAGVSRTGAPQDAAKAEARETKRKLDAAAANVKDAEGALATDKMLVEGECKTGVRKNCKHLAKEGKGTLETTIQLRTKLGEVKEAVEDNTPKRLSALTGGIVSPQQIETLQPLLMPVTLSFVAGLLITLALDHDLPMPSPAPKARKPWRWSWSKRKEPASTEPEPDESAAPSTPQLTEVPAPLRVASDTDLKRFVLACLSRAAGEETSGTAVYARFQNWCSEQTPPLAAPDAWAFARQFKAVCDRAGIRTRKDGNKVLCLDVRLAA